MLQTLTNSQPCISTAMTNRRCWFNHRQIADRQEQVPDDAGTGALQDANSGGGNQDGEEEEQPWSPSTCLKLP